LFSTAGVGVTAVVGSGVVVGTGVGVCSGVTGPTSNKSPNRFGSLPEPIPLIYSIYPLETYLSAQPSVFHDNNANPYWAIYRHLKNNIPTDNLVTKNTPNIGITEHILDEDSRIVAVINYASDTMDVDLKINPKWKIFEALYGKSEFISIANGETRVCIPNNDSLGLTKCLVVLNSLVL
jgi:hypothetical protein